MIYQIFILILLAEFGIISVALFRLVAATVDLRVAVDEVLDKLGETEAEIRQVRDDLSESKNGKKAFKQEPRRERHTIEL